MFFISTCVHLNTQTPHTQTHAHAGRQAADLSVLTEAQEVTIRLERQKKMKCEHMCLRSWVCVTMLGIDIVVTVVVFNAPLSNIIRFTGLEIIAGLLKNTSACMFRLLS